MRSPQRYDVFGRRLGRGFLRLEFRAPRGIGLGDEVRERHKFMGGIVDVVFSGGLEDRLDDGVAARGR